MFRIKAVLSCAVICMVGVPSAFAASAYRPTVIAGIGPDPRVAQQPAGQYGGGFIEFLMTGRADGAPSPARLPAYTASAAVAGEQEPDYGFEPAYGAPQPAAPASRAPIPGYETPHKAVDPAFVRQDVPYDGRQSPGTIVIDTASKFLFLVEGNGRALRYGIGVGRPGFLWSGEKAISRKAEWPDWTPPSEMLQRRPDLPRHMEGGIANPLGARAMYLGSSLYRIHGTNEPDTIGTNVSSGCIRLTNDDVSDLYSRVHVGTRVIVL